MLSITATHPEGSDRLAWGQGLILGSLIVMIAVTVGNLKLQKLDPFPHFPERLYYNILKWL